MPMTYAEHERKLKVPAVPYTFSYLPHDQIPGW